MNGEQVSRFNGDQIQQHVANMEALARANAVPFPGVLAEAFKIAPEIKVGPYSVRPFYDIDFEFLQELDHPLLKIAAAEASGQKADTSKFKRSSNWELFYIFTTSVDEVEGYFLGGEEGIGELRSEARKKFSRINGAAFQALDQAIGIQLNRYWSPCIGYEEASGGETEEATRKVNFYQATVGSPKMVSAG